MVNGGARIVMVEFTGREKESGKVFDTTSEKTAKEHGLYRENSLFRPVPVIVGKGDLLPGLDDALKGMKEGEEKKVSLLPKEAFGERRKELIAIVPLQAFRDRKINPLPGLVVDVNGQYGKVQTVSGGRVRVDFNSDLAGKEVEYDLKILKELKEPAEKAQALAEKFFPLKEGKAETMLEKGTLKIKLPKEAGKQLSFLAAPFTKSVKEVLPEIKRVEIVESFEAKATASGKAEKAGKNEAGKPETGAAEKETPAGKK